MSFVLADRVKETTTSPGTGTATLNGAVSGYQSFSAGIGANNTTYYTIADQSGSNWEVGYGTVGAGGTTLARTTVLASSNSGSLVNFSSGTQNIWVDYPASKAAIADSANALRVDGQAYVNYESAPGTTVAAGRMWYDDTLGTWNLGMGGGNITQQVGEELFVYGKASSTITDSPLQIVYQTGVVGASGVITFAPTTSGITDGNLILGCATESIATNSFGRITTYGIIHGITTNGTAYGETWADGDVIWYNPTTGNPTKTKPTAPNIKVQLGIVTHAGSGGSGSFFVLVKPGSILGGTDSNVNITTPTGGQILTYDETDSYWKNTSLSAGTGITVTPTTGGALTVANSGVTSVSGTSPVASSGGATPAISLSSGYGDTQNPYASKTANYVLAAPSGSAGVPTFRAVTALDLGTGSASSSTYLRGDLTWQSISSGITVTNDTSTATALYPTFTSATTGTISGVSVTSTKLTFVPSTGALSSTSVAGTSDERLKTNWKNIPADFLDKLSSVKSGIYDRTDVKLTQAGVSAQSLQEVLPEAVLDNGDGYLAVAYGNAALVAAIELAKEVKALRAEVELLKAK